MFYSELVIPYQIASLILNNIVNFIVIQSWIAMHSSLKTLFMVFTHEWLGFMKYKPVIKHFINIENLGRVGGLYLYPLPSSNPRVPINAPRRVFDA